jgi:hypothetical protein
MPGHWPWPACLRTSYGKTLNKKQSTGLIPDLRRGMRLATSSLPEPACPGLAQEAEMGTALVPTVSSERTQPLSPAFRPPCAPFLAHLIATAHKSPQTRIRRRAEPSEAVAAYTAIGQPRAVHPAALVRSL